MSMITNDWLEAVDAEFKKPYYRNLYQFVKEEYSRTVVYPPAEVVRPPRASKNIVEYWDQAVMKNWQHVVQNGSQESQKLQAVILHVMHPWLPQETAEQC